jgi:hypothetical protein
MPFERVVRSRSILRLNAQNLDTASMGNGNVISLPGRLPAVGDENFELRIAGTRIAELEAPPAMMPIAK